MGYANSMALKSKQKYVRSSLNAGQIELLELVYKYRFISRQLVADCLNITYGSSIYEKLEVLVKGDYLGKRFDKQLKLQAVPAAYYLTPKGMRYLQSQPEHDLILDSAIKNSYKDKTVGQDFISHTLNVCKYTNMLRRHYPELKVFTRRDMSRYSYFPSQLPDAFLSLPLEEGEQPKRFFFDLISDNMPRLALDRRIANYCEFFDEGGWDVTNSEWPILLLLCERTSTEKRAQRYVRATLNRLDMEDLSAYTTAIPLLEDTAGLDIWTSIEDADELASLSSL